jgi:hypothetical protein
VIRVTGNAGLLILAAAYGLVVVVLVVGLSRAASRDNPPPPAPRAPVDPVDAELERLLAEADRDAILNATRCDCAGCTLRREARRRRATP